MTVETLTDEVRTNRKANYDISPLLLNRWSPRSMTAEALGDDELFALFEAARWAPSSSNGQPWRFIIARRQHQEYFEKLLSFLVPPNQAWAKNAAALAVVASRSTFEYNNQPAITHAFDTGAAWENLAIESARRGLVAHGMAGFDYQRAKLELAIPEEFEVHAMLAIGRRGNPDALPEKLKNAEHPNVRRPLREILFEGAFGQSIPELPE